MCIAVCVRVGSTPKSVGYLTCEDLAWCALTILSSYLFILCETQDSSSHVAESGDRNSKNVLFLNFIVLSG
jgi:hypothetical protein